MYTEKNLSKLMTIRAADMDDAQLREALVLYHHKYIDFKEDEEDYKAERNEVALELKRRGQDVAGGLRIVLQVSYELPKDYEDSDTPAVRALDTQIAELKRVRDALVKNQVERAKGTGQARSKTVVAIREVA